nr:unnamed protein product [Digitaria exilis]
MEQVTHYLYLFLALLLPLLLLKHLKNRARNNGMKLPPGPWRLPVIGSLHHLLRTPLPHHAMADIARRLDAPLIYLKLGEVPVVVASSPDAACELMKTHDVNFASRPWKPTMKVFMVDGEGLVFARYGALWPQLRKISILELLSARRNSELMEYGIKQHEQRRAADGDGAVEEEDLVDVLLRIKKEGGLEVPLTMGMIKAVILDLFGAGSETSANTLQWAMSELVRNPMVMKKAQAEVPEKLKGKPTVTEDDLPDLRYTKLIIKETLRLHPVVPLLLPRECHESCKIMGYDVPKGATVFINVWAINRDPRYWDNAMAFKPERFEPGMVDFKGTDFEYTPFGAGRRMCPGMAFAQASMELVLAALLYHFDWELPGETPPSELDMSEEMGLTVRRKHDLYLRPVVRVPPRVTP